MAISDGVAVEEAHGTTKVRNPILSWYDETRPMWIDLVGDYAGKELFLLEGDSLLRECFADERIDFQGERDILFFIDGSLLLLWWLAFSRRILYRGFYHAYRYTYLLPVQNYVQHHTVIIREPSFLR